MGYARDAVDRDADTKTDSGSGGSWAGVRNLHVLTLVRHDDVSLIGKRAVLTSGGALLLGRGSDGLGPDVLDDGLLSRQHVELKMAQDAVDLADLGSHNGTFVNGERVTSQRLEAGDVIGLGRVLLLYHRAGPLLAPPSHPHIIGVGKATRLLLDSIDRAATRDAPALIIGETGVGKELVAQAIHDVSGATGELVTLNCGAVAEGVVHSELFGHKKGAFSGAETTRSGLVARAAGGTLFLDEIGDASPALQVSLLRLIEQREYRPVGADELLRTDARFIAATHVALDSAVSDGRFRNDLLARIQRSRVRVAPLRERREDIIPIALHIARELSRDELRIGRDLALALLRHDWPMNVRELAAAIEDAVDDLPPGETVLRLTPDVASRLEAKRPTRPRPTPQRPSAEQLRQRFVDAQGNIKSLAADLGVSRNTLYRWFKEASLDPRALRDELLQ